MRIAFYCDCDSLGGVLVYTASLAKHLKALGTHVSIISHAPKNETQNQHYDLLAASASEMVQLPDRHTPGADARHISTALAKINADIYVPNYRQAPHAASALRSHPCQTIGVCHTENDGQADIFRRYHRVTSRFVAATDATLGYVSNLLPHRSEHIAKIPHGVRIPARCQPFRGGPIKLVYHGRIRDEQKQISKMLDVAEHLEKMGVAFTLRLVGSGPDTSKYAERISNSALKPHVSLTGDVQWEELSGILAQSHVTLLTSDHEGFCFSLAEGMGAGLPGVAFRLGVIEDYLTDGHNGVVIDQDDTAGMAKAIGVLQQNPVLWAAMSDAAHQTISSRFSWSETASRYVTLFEDSIRSGFESTWPMFRPAWIPETGRRSSRSIMERIGKELRVW